MKNIFEYYVSCEALYNRMILPIYQKYGLTYMEFTILMFLANNLQYDTAAEIVRYRHITKSHVSVSIHSLCKKGFLFEEYRNNNRRTIHLNVTENADKIVNEGRNVQLHFREILLGGFSEYEKGLFFEYMERMDRNISTQLKSMEIKKQSDRGKRVE